jgi:hypothetical protein
MSRGKIDPNKTLTETPPKDNTELSDEALDKVSAGAPGDEFLKIDPIPGESPDSKHRD